MKNTATPKSPPEGLSNFDSLPDSAHVRAPVVEALFACKPSTLWKWIKEGRFPAPRIQGHRHTAWNVGDLRQKLKEYQGAPHEA